MRWFSIALDVQFLIGLLLYVWLSPFIRDAWADMGATMRNAPLRFFAVEHVTGMLIGIALAHVGKSKIGKAADRGAEAQARRDLLQSGDGGDSAVDPVAGHAWWAAAAARVRE